MSHSELSHACCRVIEQGLELLETQSAASYTVKVEQAFNASIGAHYRHCLEHFEALVEGAKTGIVDYDARKRDARIETDLDFARQRSRALLQELSEIQVEDLAESVRVHCRVASGEGGSPSVESSLAREAMYAVAHTIHHYALIKVLCELLEIKVPKDFGVAPSTLHHQKQSASPVLAQG